MKFFINDFFSKCDQIRSFSCAVYETLMTVKTAYSKSLYIVFYKFAYQRVGNVLFFGKFGELCFLETILLRLSPFALLPMYYGVTILRVFRTALESNYLYLFKNHSEPFFAGFSCWEGISCFS